MSRPDDTTESAGHHRHRPATLTHAEVNRRFLAMDIDRTLMTVGFDGWLAWPIVKERLWLLAQQRVNTGDDHGRSPAEVVGRLGGGLWQLALGLARPRRARYAFLYEERDVVLPDGRTLHPHLGSAAQQRPDDLHYVYAWNQAAGASPVRRRIIHDRCVGALAAVAARAVRATPALRQVATRITEVAMRHLPELEPGAIQHVVADQLARFRVRRRIFRALFSAWHVERVVVLDPDAKAAEIVAARDLGLPVVEVQHGMFSAREPEYSWTKAHREVPLPLPLPDRVIVFGPAWQRELVGAGYWHEHEVLLASSPALQAYRDRRAARDPSRRDVVLGVMYASQAYMREDALAFWREVLSAWRARGVRCFRLDIKLHPAEQSDAASYWQLAEEFSDLCRVLPASVDGLDALLEADIVVGYTSLMLLEALAIGVPVLSLRGGRAAEGLADTFGLPVLRGAIEELTGVDELLARLAALEAPAAREESAERALASGREIFDVDGDTVEMILDRLELESQ